MIKVRTFVLLLASGTLGACALFPGMSSNEAGLTKVVAFDTGCAQDQIKVLSKDDSQAGFGLYGIDACGKQLKYKRTGTVYHAADKSPY